MLEHEPDYEYYRFPGPRPFRDTHRERHLFFGRDQEKLTLLQMLLADNLAVLHGPPGVGKTSLLQAGINQELKLRNYIPIDIRCVPGNMDLIPLIYKRIASTADSRYLYHDPGEEASLWQYFKTQSLRSPDNTLLHPFLILDQFDTFLLSSTKEKRDLFFNQLSDLVNNNIPQTLKENIKTGAPLLYNMMPPQVKIILVMHSLSLPYVEEYIQKIPGLTANRMKLAALTREQARLAIEKPVLAADDSLGPSPFQWAPDTVEEMLNFLGVPQEASGFSVIDRVEPFSLQLLCRCIEETVKERANTGESDNIVQPEDLGGEKGMKKMVDGYFDRQLNQVTSGWTKRKARRLLKKGLVRDNRVGSLEKGDIEDKYKLPEEILSGLEEAGLVRSGSNSEDTYYQLGHEKLIPSINAASLRFRVKQITALGFIFICILLLVGISAKSTHYISHRNRPAPTRKARLAQHIKFGNIHMRRGEYSEAEQRFLKAAELSPRYGPIYNTIGIALVRQGKFEDAIASYRKAIELTPKSNSPRGNLAEAELINGDFSSAYNDSQEVLKQPKIHPDLNLAMRFVSITALLYQGKEKQAYRQLIDFLTYYKSLPQKIAKIWNYNDIRRFHTIDRILPRERREMMLLMMEILDDSHQKGMLKIEKLEALVKQVFDRYR